MDSKNKNAIDKFEISKPECKAKVVFLGSFNPNASDIFIKDPYGGSQEDFEFCYNRIKDSCVEFLKHLVKKQKEKSDRCWKIK